MAQVGTVDFSDLKHFLRRYDFPQSTQQALIQLEKLTRLNYTPQHQLCVNEIVDEFVFGEIDIRGIHRNRFSAVQELQLLEVLCSYFESQKEESIRSNVFLHLFPILNGNLMEHRTKLLSQLLSLAIAANNLSILQCGAVWMMSHVGRSKHVTEVARMLVTDYFSLVPQSASLLKDLPRIAPLFTANFITALTSLYNMSVDPETQLLNLPPPMLLRQITLWITDHPMLCLAPRLQNMPIVYNKPFVITPIPGLLAWTVLAPVINRIETKHVTTNKLKQIQEHENCINKHKEMINNEIDMYSKLHLGLLESMIELENQNPPPTYKTLMSADDVISIIHQLIQNSKVMQSAIDEKSVDRLLQALQVSVSRGQFYGNAGEIMGWLKQLPQTRLMKIFQMCYSPLTLKNQLGGPIRKT